MLSQLGHVMVGVADSMMVGQLGREPLGAVSFGNSIFVVFMVFGIGISAAITPLTAKADGQGRPGKIIQLLKNGLWMCIISGLLLFILLYICTFFLGVFNQPTEVEQLAIPYTRIVGASLIPFMVFQALRQFAEGLSRTRDAMMVAVGMNLLNILLNYLLIFGNWGFPALGLEGAALATLISRIMMALSMVVLMYYKAPYKHYARRLSDKNLSRNMTIRLSSLGIPIGIQYIFEVSAFSLAAIMAGWLGTVQLAAHQIAINLASVTYMMASGISAASTIRVGNQLGKKDYNTMREAAMTSFTMGILFMGCTALLFILLRHWFPVLYIDDLNVQQLAASLLIIAAVFQISDGIQVVGLGVLRGMADVKIPTIITMIAYWFMGLPVAYLLGFTFNLGAHGIWIGLFIGLTTAAVLLYLRFKRISGQYGS
ncbi:MAG: MATE family efflux transporter [Cyclobacteriaceae bacterium]|nr:MATE family efflux transporter [Cyclobacteriaceae bacterium]